MVLRGLNLPSLIPACLPPWQTWELTVFPPSMQGPIATCKGMGHVLVFLALPNTRPVLSALKISVQGHSSVLGSMMISSQSFLGKAEQNE